MKKILLYVQSSYGLGHLFQVIKLASWLSEYQVEIVYGGQYFQEIEIPENARMHQLSPIIENKKSELEALEGKLGKIKQKRKRQLLRLFRDLQPDLVFVEQFPFGRFRFESEIQGLLEYAKREETPVFCMKTVIKEKKRDPKREQKIRRYLDKYFRNVLVFSDPDIETLEKETGIGQDKTIYLGYLTWKP